MHFSMPYVVSGFQMGSNVGPQHMSCAGCHTHRPSGDICVVTV